MFKVRDFWALPEYAELLDPEPAGLLRLCGERQRHRSGNARQARCDLGGYAQERRLRGRIAIYDNSGEGRLSSPVLFRRGIDALTNMMTTLDRNSRAATRGWSDITIRNVFVIPTVAFLIIFNVFPLLYSLGFSFTDFRASSKAPVNFVGLKNYIDLARRSRHLAHFLDDAVVRDRLGCRPVRRRLRTGAAAQPSNPGQGPADDAAAAADDAVAGRGGPVLEAHLRSVLGHPQLRTRARERPPG